MPAQLTPTESPKTYLSGMRIHPALLYAALFSPAAIVTVVFVVARPQDASGLAVAGLLALRVVVLGLPMVVRKRRGEQAQLDSAASSLVSAFTGGAVVHAVGYGLGEPDSQSAGSDPSSWDLGPSRTGAQAADKGVLLARGTDGAALDLPLAEVQGAVLGNSVEVLLTRYAKCLDGRQDVANRRIEDLLREYE
ncbi:hypothetical protein FE633_29405 [Streptomyces montanus]|uniref:Uncharacterized protein n=1 Tax=Streptomyces montanus TaxID=2580423 RepID=A0A5R9FG50_9ACTN|nr:hypothetical protein [Streptomyces montanus]TLS42767.1 hypothetical protein FE633_29405 [Streptomyces montanus]